MADSASSVSLQASASALDHLTTLAGEQGPSSQVHDAAGKESTHSFLSRFFPSKETIEGLENRFHMGNYVISRETGEKSFEEMSAYVRVGMHLLYYGRAQERLLHSGRVEELLLNQSVKMGQQYDDPASKEHIQPFIESFGLQDSMKEMVEPDPNAYATFNDFFARSIRPDARPAAEPDNAAVVSSPADCRLTTFPTIDAATKFWVKGEGFSLARLFDDEELAKKFEGGSMAIARLAPQDYHRWHSPVSGTVTSMKDIKGTYYTVNPQAINEPGVVDVFCENRRHIMTIQEQNSSSSEVAVAAIGAMLVGSIRIDPSASTIGSQVTRAQPLGEFRYGGSTVIVIFPPGRTTFDADLVKNSTVENCETLMRVGWRMGA